MYMSGSKKLTVKIHDHSVDLKETKNLYGCLMILTRSNRDIDQKNAVGNYEFTLTPRALFAPDGSMLACTDKSKLIHDLEKLPSTVDTIKYTKVMTSNEQDDPILTSPKIAIVNGMVLVQKMARNKKGTFGTVKNLVQNINNRLTTLTAGFSEVILIFDTYKPDSLKQKTRKRCQQGKAPVQYKIEDDTNIKHIP